MRIDQIKNWLEPGRVVPLATILVAALVEIFAALHFIPNVSSGEHVLICLLGLVAIDSLTERMKILEKIKEHLDGSPSSSPLRKRADLPSISKQIESANEILLLAISGVALLQSSRQELRQRIEGGCTFRVVLLDPNSPQVQNWSKMVGATEAVTDINSGLSIIKSLQNSSSQSCRLRLSPVPPPFSLFAINPKSEDGVVCVDFHTIDILMVERPLMRIEKRFHREWFDLFIDQFEKAWGNIPTGDHKFADSSKE